MLQKAARFWEVRLKSFNFWPFSVLGRRLAAVRTNRAPALPGAVEAMVCCFAYYETRPGALRQRPAGPHDQVNAVITMSAADASGAHGSGWRRALLFQRPGLAARRMRGVRHLRAVFPALGAGRILPGAKNVSGENFPTDFAGFTVPRPAGCTRLTASYKEHGALRMRTLAGAFAVQGAHARAPLNGRAALARSGLTMASINVNSRCVAPIKIGWRFEANYVTYIAYDSAFRGEIVRRNKILCLPRRCRRQIGVLGARRAWRAMARMKRRRGSCRRGAQQRITENGLAWRMREEFHSVEPNSAKYRQCGNNQKIWYTVIL